MAASKWVGERLVPGPARLNPRKEKGQMNTASQLYCTRCLGLHHSRSLSKFRMRRCCLAIWSASCDARIRAYACIASLASAPGCGSAGSARRHARMGRDRVCKGRLTVSVVRCVICCRSREALADDFCLLEYFEIPCDAASSPAAP